MICLGSSCFSRGNKMTVKAIQNYITENQYDDKVYFHGGHCFGKCENGPVIKINDDFYEQQTSAQAIDLIEKVIKK